MSCSYLFLILYFLLTACICVNGELCLMCENGAAGLVRPHHFLDAHGSTCISKSLEMAADYSAGSGRCHSQQVQFSDCCCNANAQCPSIDQAPTAAPVYNGPTGNYPSCNICKGRSGIGNPAMVINMLYIGVGTCKQYYDYGLAGLIQTHMCDPLQHYAYEPCGCGEYHPSNNIPVQQANNIGTGSNSNNNNNNSNNAINSNSNSQHNNNNVDDGSSVPERKNPNNFASHGDAQKLSNGRGGAGAVQHGHRNLKSRNLKGSKP